MADAKLAPNMPQWMIDHTNRYLSSGGTDGHLYTASFPNMPTLTVPSLLLTTTGRKSGRKYIFPLFYGKAGNSYFIVASKGGAPDHPGWYKNLLAYPEAEIMVGTQKLKVRARTASAPCSSSRRTRAPWPSPTATRPARSPTRSPSSSASRAC